MSTSTPAKSDNIPRSNTLPSCNLCKKRKVRCDRSDPCSNCRRAGSQCAFPARTRLPRGRQGGRKKGDSELLKRISNLENLVQTLENTPASKAARTTSWQEEILNQGPNASDDSKTSPPVSGHTSNSRSGSEQHTGAPVWNTITDEINGLRYVLGNDASSDEDESSVDGQDPDAPSPGSENHSRFVIGGPSAFAANSDALHEPTRPRMLALLQIYMNNVHPVSKVLHGPSLCKYFEGSSETLECSPGAGGLQALRFAIYHAATTSLDSQECLQQLGEEKTSLLARFRSGTQVALAKADFVTTVELSTLQALLLFLLTVRSYDSTRLSWTLFGICLRIAIALGLHREGHNSRLPLFQAEMRRRLWWQICQLDSSLCIDRGTDPAIAQGTYNTRMPLHINDAEIWVGGPNEVPERKEFTDMTFCSLVSDSYETTKSINFIPPSERDCPQTSKPDDFWERRKQMVVACQRKLEDKYTRHCNPKEMIHWATLMVADNIIATLWLNIYRPMQQTSMASSQFQHPKILDFATEVMERYESMVTHPAAKSLQWLSASYVQWHPLAVMLAELCVQTEGPVVQRAWKCVDAVFENVAEHVADSTKGMLWRPIKKLRAKAQKAKQNAEALNAIGGKIPTTGANASTADLAFAPTAKENFFGLPSAPQVTDSPGLENMGPSMMEGLVQSTTSTQPWPLPEFTAPENIINWDPWVISDAQNQIAYPEAMNHDAWANWENFVTDFQGEVEIPIEKDFR